MSRIDIPNEFYQLHVGVEFRNLSILWQLIEGQKDVIYNLIDYKSRRQLKKKTLPEIRTGQMPSSKYIERHLKVSYTKEQVQKSVSELEIYVGNYLQGLAEGLSNHLYIEGIAKENKLLKQEFLTWLKERLKINPNLSKDSRKDLSAIYKAYHELHSDIPIATLKTWKNRKRR